MDNTPEQTAAPSALDKIAAALAELGQETAAAIAERAGVGYSTATKRLRVLEQAGQVEAFHADDRRTLWRLAASAETSADGDNAPATDAAADAVLPHTPTQAADSAEDDSEGSDGSPAAAQDVGSVLVAGPDDAATRITPEDARRSTPDNDVDQPTPQEPPLQPAGTQSTPAATAVEGDETAAAANVEAPVAVGTAGEAEPGHNPDPVGTSHSTTASGQTEDPNAPTAETKPRRSKGSLRGAIRDVLEAHPDQPFKTSLLCKAIDKANEGTDSAKASAGAVVNALHKLVTDGVAVQVAERPAAFQLASKTE